MDVMTKEQRSRNMQRINGKDTKPERKLRLALWHAGIRYRKNYRILAGTPDIAITRYKLAVFVDGDFWHGKGHQEAPGEQIRTNREYWVLKLTRNVERDKEVNDALTADGWLVLRYWESDIKKNVEAVVEDIRKYMP